MMSSVSQPQEAWDRRHSLSIRELELILAEISVEVLDVTGLIFVHLLRGEYFTRTIRFKEAETEYLKARQMADETTDDQQLVAALLGIAHIQGTYNLFDSAESTLEAALAAAKECADSSAEGVVLAALARINWHQQKNRLAVVRLAESRRILSSCDSPRLVALPMLGMLNQLGSAGDMDGVEETLKQALDIVQKSNWNSLLPAVLFGKGLHELNLQPLDKAETTLQQLLMIALEYNLWFVAKAHWGLSWAAIRRENWRESLRHLMACRERVLDTPNFVTDVDVARAKCHVELGEPIVALALLENAPSEPAYRDDNFFELRAKAQLLLGNVEAAASDFATGLALARKAYPDEARQKLASTQLAMVQEQIESERRTAAIRLEHLESQLASTTAFLLSHSNAIEQLRRDLTDLIRNNEPNAAVRRIQQILKQRDADTSHWLKFEEQFQQVHPEFRAALAVKYPELTKQELRICQLLRVGMKSHEIARLICISERGVENHRFNIRKKLGLKTEQSIVDFLASVT